MAPTRTTVVQLMARYAPLHVDAEHHHRRPRGDRPRPVRRLRSRATPPWRAARSGPAGHEPRMRPSDAARVGDRRPPDVGVGDVGLDRLPRSLHQQVSPTARVTRSGPRSLPLRCTANTTSSPRGEHPRRDRLSGQIRTRGDDDLHEAVIATHIGACDSGNGGATGRRDRAVRRAPPFSGRPPGTRCRRLRSAR